MTPRSPASRVVRALLFVGAASAALAAAGPDALLPFRDVAGAAAEVSVAFVVDFGGGAAPVVGCVKVPAGDNGYAALAAFATQENQATPVYNSSGLLCSINGVPGNAPAVCGERVPGGYDYWAYWHGGTGSWSYAGTGAFATVQSGDVEGWRYENPGNSNPTDARPGATPDYAAICGVTPTSPSTTTAGSPSTTAAGPTVTVPPAGAAHPSTPSAAPSEPVPVPTTGVPSTSSTTGPSASSSAPPSVPASGVTAAGPSSQPSALSATPTANDQSGGGSATPLIVGGLLVLLLASGAVFGWRRRTSTP